MSHEATTWAIKVRGLAPAAKLVLWHLADRYHPDNGCFPRQTTLAADCELSKSSLNSQLEILEKNGLIRRERRIDPVTKQQIPTRYRLACEAGFRPVSGAVVEAVSEDSAAVVRCNNTPAEGDENGKSRVQNLDSAPAEPSPENGQSRVQLFGLGYNAEPVIEPVRMRECADADGQGGTPADPVTSQSEANDDPTLEAFRNGYPRAAYEPQAKLRATWDALPVSSQRAALDGLAGFLAGAQAGGRKFLPKGVEYLTERLWNAAEARAATVRLARKAGDRIGAMETLERWSRPWWAVVLARLARGERPGLIWDRALQGKGWAVPADDPALAMAERLTQFPSDGETGQGWQRWLATKGCRVPWMRGERVWLWMPGAEPGDFSNLTGG